MDWISVGTILTFLLATFPYRTHSKKFILPKLYHIPPKIPYSNFINPQNDFYQPNFINHFDKMNFYRHRPSKYPYIGKWQANHIIYKIPIIKTTKQNYWVTEFNEALSGLFLSKDEIYGLKDTCNQNITSYGGMKDYRSFWTVEDNSCNATYAQRRNKRDSGCSACCQTEWSADSPVVVEYKGRDYDVVTPPSGYQVIFQGKCKKGTRCVCGECIEESTYFTWILVADPELNYFPPVRFVPVKYSRMCQCVNRGRKV